MKIFYLLLLAGTATAVIQRSKAVRALPSGVSSTDFTTGPQGMLQVSVPVGESEFTLAPFNVLFNLDFLTKDVAIIGGPPTNYDTNISLNASIDPFMLTTTVVTYDAYYNEKDITGQAWYEAFNLSGVVASGQGFTFARSPFWLDPSVMGMAFNASSTPAFPNMPVITTAWQQADAANNIVSFAGFNYSGQMYMGGINFDNVTQPITNYSVIPQDGFWSLALENIRLGTANLGYNGKLTVAFNSLYHMAPMPAFTLIRQLLGFTGPTYTRGKVTVASGPCLIGAPNLTYVVDEMNLTLTPGQYIIPTENPEVCYLAFAGWNGAAPDGLLYTLGSAVFGSGAYAVFDFNLTSPTFGFA